MTGARSTFRPPFDARDTRHEADPLARKLACYAPLDKADRQALLQVSESARRIDPKQDLALEGEAAQTVYLVLKGFACRYKLLANGQRQILDYLLPGDLSESHAVVAGLRDHSIATLSACTVASLSHAALATLAQGHPHIGKALTWCALGDVSVAREWLVNLGQRPADQRMAHLFCEVLVRLQAVGMAGENGYELPITQMDLAETVGLTSVHVNRTLQSLRAAGLIVLNNRRLTLPDVERLKTFCGFRANYLRLPERGDGHPAGGVLVPPSGIELRP